MTIFQILILSLIQGLTEFLPVSSSGHLILLPHLFNWTAQGMTMDIALHVGTLIAVIFYFSRDIIPMVTETWGWIFSGFKKEKFSALVKMSMAIVIGTIPAIVAALMLKKIGFYEINKIAVIGWMSIIFGLLLFAADRWGRPDSERSNVSFLHAFLIGVAQSLALIPGASRSGSCITAGLFLGYDRSTAARFAFLLSIPAILAAASLAVVDYCTQSTCLVPVSDLLLGIVFSAMAGLFAIRFMLSYLISHSLTVFVVYRVLLGLGILYFMDVL